MREDSKLGIFLIEVPRYSGCALSQRQDLGCYLISLPLPAPGLSAGSEKYLVSPLTLSHLPLILRGGNFSVKVELVDVDPLVSGQRCVSAAGLEPQPGLVLVLPGLHVLASLEGHLVEPAAHHVPALVQGRLLVFVLQGKSKISHAYDLIIMFLSPHLNCDQSSGPDEVLGNVGVAPEAGVVEGGVTVLVNKVHICLMSEKLKNGREW